MGRVLQIGLASTAEGTLLAPADFLYAITTTAARRLGEPKDKQRPKAKKSHLKQTLKIPRHQKSSQSHHATHITDVTGPESYPPSLTALPIQPHPNHTISNSPNITFQKAATLLEPALASGKQSGHCLGLRVLTHPSVQQSNGSSDNKYMEKRTISVSNSRPRAIVVPI